MSITAAGCSAAPAASPASHRCKCRAAEAVTGYARVPAAENVGVALDDFTALYHRAAGITHLVTSPVPELLDVLGEAPLGLGAIAARLASVCESAAIGSATWWERVCESGWCAGAAVALNTRKKRVQ